MNIYKQTRKWMAGICAVCLLSLLSSCLKDTRSNAPQPPVAYLAFIQTLPGEQPLDFYLNSNKVNTVPIMYGNSIDYIRAFTGTRIANFYLQGSTTNLIVADTIQLKQDSAYTLFLVNTTSKPQTLFLADTLVKPADGKASLRFVNTSPNSTAVDLAIKGGAVLVAGKSFKGHSSFVQLNGNTSYNLEVRQAGTSTVLASLDNVNLGSGVVYTFWLQGLIGNTDGINNPTINGMINAFY